MVLIIFFTRTRHEEDNLFDASESEEVDEDHPLNALKGEAEIKKRNTKHDTILEEDEDLVELQ